MSFFTEGLFHSPSAPRVRRSVSWSRLGARLKAFGVSLTRRRQIHALSQLDDRMLSDIGVTRSDIEEAARWSLWGDPGERLAELAEGRRAARERAAAELKPRRD
ncbi:DUF1127 domain-containing protein [Chelatococcus sambhunathii]|uniref:DUF1127 domain-containing protein n=1 Tax=Chelatococcus sambhunathii TaxID=363953 RepID=A0ABU1DK47_9HYPH|nr:DUF1127 domain-containing protein [Chelatococcus sambhunathii]MDR4308501.1 DUF1127 domain-containing protein [Chelatococcus sambhunathii]